MADLIGRMDRRVKLWSIGNAVDPSTGAAQEVRSLIRSAWASYMQLSGRDIEAAATRQTAEECKFRFRYARDISGRLAIESDGEVFRVVRIEPIGRRQWLDVYARREP